MLQAPIEHEQSLGEYLSGTSTVELEGHFFTVAVNTTKQSLATALVVANADAMLLSSTRTRSTIYLDFFTTDNEQLLIIEKVYPVSQLLFFQKADVSFF